MYLPCLVTLTDDHHFQAWAQPHLCNEVCCLCGLSVHELLFPQLCIACTVVELAGHKSMWVKEHVKHVHPDERKQSVLLEKDGRHHQKVAVSCSSLLKPVLINVNAVVLLATDWTKNVA